MKLQGKVAVVTGGGSGFGAGIVRKFVAEGARVVVADLNLDAAQAVAAAAGDAAFAVRADVASAADTRAMLDAAQARFGGFDILVNNAGIGHLPQPLETLPEADFDRIVAVNMKAIYLALYQARRGRGLTPAVLAMLRMAPRMPPAPGARAVRRGTASRIAR